MPRMNRLLSLGATLLLAGCQSDIYLRDGVTDGDTFFVAPSAYAGDDPVVASWVRYSLIRSSCQLRVGGENPARVSSYHCEFRARRHLVDAWLENRDRGDRHEDVYLDSLVRVHEAGFLDEYAAHYLGTDEWQLPQDLDLDAFAGWRRMHLKGHRAKTRLTGYWGYRRTAAGSHRPE